MTEDPYVAIGGLFVVCPRAGKGGRGAIGGGGGGGRLPVGTPLSCPCCLLNAAIRWERVVK